MNNARRNALSNAIELLEKVKEVIEDVYCEEEEAYDNMPESLQDSERGEAMCDNIDILSSLPDDIDEIIESLQEVIER